MILFTFLSTNFYFLSVLARICKRLQLHVLYLISFPAHCQMNYERYDWTTGSFMCLCPYSVRVLALYNVLTYIQYEEMLRDLERASVGELKEYGNGERHVR